ncbi:MAG: hypothetical protein KJS92_03220 [Bacteroidetes bacterium]|nr:hypothetical protein [Bacteroidota bacterium]
MKKSGLLWLLLLGVIFSGPPDLQAQKPEFRYYLWGNQAPAVVPPVSEPGIEPLVLADTRLLEYASGSVFILIHRKVYYHSWKALQAHRRERFPGKLLQLDARLWDDSGRMLNATTQELVSVDSQQQGPGTMLFGGRRPGTVLEYLWVTEIPHTAYLSQWYPMPVAAPVKLTLIHPPELTLQYGVAGMQASAERQNRDGKVFTELLLQKRKDSLQSADMFPPGLRIILRKTRAGDMPGWDDAAVQVLQSMAQTLSAKEIKALNHVYKQAEKLQPASQLQILSALPFLFRKHHLTYNHALMEKLLSMLSMEHQMVWTGDRRNLPPDFDLPYLPDMTAMFLHVPGAARFISSSGALMESVPDEYAGCNALFIPVTKPDKPYWGSLPKPSDLRNRDVGNLLWSGDSLFQFRRVFSGRNAQVFRSYGNLSAAARAETDIGVCRELLPGSWLLDCRASRDKDGDMIFEGVCAAPGIVARRDSLISINLREWLLPPAHILVTPGMLRERSLILPAEKFAIADVASLRDTSFTDKASGVNTNFRVRREGKWMVVTCRITKAYDCIPDKTATGSCGLPVTVMLRKNKK